MLPFDERAPLYSNSTRHLMKLLQDNGFKPIDESPLPMPSHNIHRYDGAFMALKYGTAKAGGWHIAKMAKLEDDDCMKLTFCFSDNMEAHWKCVDDMMIVFPLHAAVDHKSRSWLLLEQTAPSASGEARNPEARSRGRPQERRHRPAAGPLSR